MTAETATTTNANTARPKSATTAKRRPRTTKKDTMIRLLRRKDGADIATISGKLGWQPHTTRAALTGLRKSGYEIASEKPAGGQTSRYRIVAEPASDAV